ncbi:MAG: VCBS repeat-containing protein [Bryobacteraceae bacterium]
MRGGLKKGLLVVLLIIVLASVAFCLRYPGFMAAGVDYTLHTTLHERMNASFMLLYWMEWVGRQTPDAQNFYSFDTAQSDDPFNKALIEYHRGNFGEAVNRLQDVIAKSGENEKRVFWLGMAQLRQGEAFNCLPNVMSADHMMDMDHAQYCALPIRKFHQEPKYARAAAKTFLHLIETYGKDNHLYHWLLNYACMTSNDFPDGVPPAYRVTPEFVKAFYGEGKDQTLRDFANIKFDEQAGHMGINIHNAGRGVGVEDFDRDGYLDIVTGGSFDNLRYFHNTAGKGFEDWTERAGFGGFRQPFFITVADIDNDGAADLLVSRMFHDGITLFRNKGDGTFEDVTAKWNLPASREDNALSSTWAAAWGDVNNDGKIDLFVSRLGMEIPFAGGLLARPRFYSALYMNEGGRFVEKTAEYGLGSVVKDMYFIGAAFGDYDNDGYTDLYMISPIVNETVLLRNLGGKKFEVSKAYDGVNGGFVGAFVDVNHDGRLDIFEGGFSDARSSIEMTMFGANPDDYHTGKSSVFIQQANGKFEEAKGFFDMFGGTMGASFGDFDNDGCYDFYLGTGSPEGWFIFPKLMFKGILDGGNCALRTKNISATNNFATVQKGHGIVFFDFNNDGLQDIYSSLGGMWPADRWPNQFFVNQSDVKNHFVKIRLRGRKTNSLGIGAKITVTAGDASGAKIVRQALVDQKTAFGSGPYLTQVGLANAAVVDGAEVYWPASGCRKSYPLTIDGVNVLDEAACDAK